MTQLFVCADIAGKQGVQIQCCAVKLCAQAGTMGRLVQWGEGGVWLIQAGPGCSGQGGAGALRWGALLAWGHHPRLDCSQLPNSCNAGKYVMAAFGPHLLC